MRTFDIKPITEKLLWGKVLAGISHFSFLQDWQWGEVEQALGRYVIRLGIYEHHDLVGVCQMVGYRAKKGNFLLIAHGPLFLPHLDEEYDQSDAIKQIILYLQKNRVHKKYAYVRLQLQHFPEKEFGDELSRFGFVQAPIFSVTENFWVSDIAKSDSNLLGQMSSHHKKSVKDSLQKPYLEITEETSKKGVDIFWELYEQLADRKDFVPYSRELIQKETGIFSKDNKAKLYIASVEGKPISSALIIYSGDTASYHHGASLPAKEPISYKLHFQAMRDARDAGMHYYNFWGIAEDASPEHPWYGLTQFKKGFGGNLYECYGAMDYPLSFRYIPIRLLETLRKKKKKL
ncbi:MAG: hypothetical protein UU76_C0024G0004 [Parcubacteria group bacterium GW2011_GWC1_41_7]|nr:MAG: hypothetical protein UU76_C0024G0004 [Parcubacteria group bacterium GW2011_GWC1_41_7]